MMINSDGIKIEENSDFEIENCKVIADPRDSEIKLLVDAFNESDAACADLEDKNHRLLNENSLLKSLVEQYKDTLSENVRLSKENFRLTKLIDDLCYCPAHGRVQPCEVCGFGANL